MDRLSKKSEKFKYLLDIEVRPLLGREEDLVEMLQMFNPFGIFNY